MTDVALSFDNGPDAEVTPRVLDVLAERNVKAHFFVLGRQLEDPGGLALVVRALREGHVVGNHSFTHSVPLGDDPRPDVVQREIVATERLLEPLAIHGPRLFRPFGGGGVLGPHLLQPAAVRYLVEHEYSCVLWNSVPRDWDDPHGWPARAHADCRASEHVSMVLHDVPGACLDELGTWLDEALARGVRFVLDQPASCVPLSGGQIRGDLAAITRGGLPV